jgi:hypothetical protein
VDDQVATSSEAGIPLSPNCEFHAKVEAHRLGIELPESIRRKGYGHQLVVTAEKVEYRMPCQHSVMARRAAEARGVSPRQQQLEKQERASRAC